MSLETKDSNLVTKISDPLPGHIQRRRVRCGKANCKCARGEFHTAYYRAWDTDGVRYRKYVRRSDVATVQAACAAHKELQAKMRAGRAEYKQTLAQFRAILRRLS